eukprot:c8063_g1_i1.p1 GENE.c8063_g1_i1~~c8063_g1_i1.p1  ORF type:complete len:719 (-),score=206.15 c8063_g1_i1:65-2188(-)
MKPRVLLIGVVVAVVLHSCHSASFTKSFGPASTANSKDQALQAPVIQLVRGGSCDAAHGLVGSTSVIDHRDLGNPGRISLLGLPFTFLDQVVFVSPPSYNDHEPCVPRLQQSTDSTKPGYKLWLAENEKAEVYHGIESIGWVVLENGAGCGFYVGSATVTSEFTTIDLPSGLGNRPWVFTMIQSTNNGADSNMQYDTRPKNLRGFVKTRMSLRDNSARRFQLKLETDEASTVAPSSELVGYLAIDSGCTRTQDKGDASDFSSTCPPDFGVVTLGGTEYDYGVGVVKTTKSQMATQAVGFAQRFGGVPVVLINMQTFADKTPAEIRTISVSQNGFEFIIEEDTTKTKDTTHDSEWVAWLALCVHTPTPTPTPTATPPTPTPSPTPTCAIPTSQVAGLVGTASDVDYHDINNPGRINLSNLAFTFVDPVVFVAGPSRNEIDACVPRIQRTTSPDSFKLWLAETQKSDVKHPSESVGYLVLENGAACNYYVGKTTVTNAFTAVDLPSPTSAFGVGLGPRPWIFQMIQSANNGATPNIDASNPPNNLRGYVKPRMTMNDNSPSRFRLKLETDQDSNTAPSWETVGYLAINSGCSKTQAAGDLSDYSTICPAVTSGKIMLGTTLYDYVLGIKKSGVADPDTVQFGSFTFKDRPVVLANMQSFLDSASAEIRIVRISTTGFFFTVEASQDRDGSVITVHNGEWVAWIAIGILQ